MNESREPQLLREREREQKDFDMKTQKHIMITYIGIVTVKL